MGDVSAHFDRSEFRCKGFGRWGHQRHTTPVDPELLVVLERIRAHAGRPLPITSGHRCPWWNRKVGGASGGAHPRGEAADIPQGFVRRAEAEAMGARGTGVKNGWVTHVDVRHTGSVARWSYD